MELLIPIFAVLGFFGAGITWIYMHYRSKHNERMALIESGTSAEIFSQKTLDDKSNALKIGMLLTGGGIGFYLGVLSETLFGLEEGLGSAPLAFVGGGIGLILFYIIIRKQEN